LIERAGLNRFDSRSVDAVEADDLAA